MEREVLNTLKTLLRESSVPYFTDEELDFYYNRNNKDLNATLYECLCVKSEDTTMSISGMSLSDTSKYFRKLASKYRPRNTGILRG